MFQRIRKWLEGEKADASRSESPTDELKLLALVNKLIKANNLTENKCRTDRDTLSGREKELKAQWKRETDEGRKQDRLIDIRYTRDDRTAIENRLIMLYNDGQNLREARRKLEDAIVAKGPKLSPEQIDGIRTTLVEATRGLRETQIAYSQLRGVTTFSRELDAGLKELEVELKSEVQPTSKSTPIDTPNYAERELDSLRRELEGEAE